MSTRIEAPFDVTRWDQGETREEAPRAHHATVLVGKTFAGADMTGTSEGMAILCQADPADPMAGGGYIVSEVFTGSLGGRSGSFAFQHRGIMGAGTPPTTWGHIIPGTGADELSGISGELTIERTEDGAHFLALTYTLD